MKNNPDLKFVTTIKINEVLINICKNKKINIQELIRQTYHFLMSINLYYVTKNINILLPEIFEEYEDSEYISLSPSLKQIKTHVTKKQHCAYTSIKRENRVLYFNKLISIIINNIDYRNKKFEHRIQQDPIINKFTVQYFLNKTNNTEILMTLMESLLAKGNHVLNNTYISDTFYKGLYYRLFEKGESNDFISQYNLTKFLQKELEKIFFCMLIVYKIKYNAKSSHGQARKIYKTYNDKYKNIYNEDINLFMKNEIQIYSGLSEIEEFKEVFEFILAMHPSEKERVVVGMSFLQYTTLKV